jgi:NADH-quinone oxidoreductase subunit A
MVTLSDFSPIIFLFLFGFGLSLIFVSFSILLSTQKPDTSKVSPYECWFEPFNDSRNKFEVRYFIIAILFLLFDVETIFIFPGVFLPQNIGNFNSWIMLDFLIELCASFVYAWFIGGLEWE